MAESDAESGADIRLRPSRVFSARAEAIASGSGVVLVDTGAHEPGLDLAALGIPSEQDYVAAYCRRTGRDHLPDLDYLTVFVMFRLAGILHGIKGRLARGNASSAHAAAMVAQLEPLADLALAQARAARLQ